MSGPDRAERGGELPLRGIAHGLAEGRDDREQRPGPRGIEHRLELIPVASTHNLSVVMPGLVPGTHVFRATMQGVGDRAWP